MLAAFKACADRGDLRPSIISDGSDDIRARIRLAATFDQRSTVRCIHDDTVFDQRPSLTD